MLIANTNFSYFASRFRKKKNTWPRKLNYGAIIIILLSIVKNTSSFIAQATNDTNYQTQDNINSFRENSLFMKQSLDFTLENECLYVNKIQNTRLNPVPVSEVQSRGEKIWGDVNPGFLKFQSEFSSETQDTQDKNSINKKNALFPCWLDYDLIKIGQKFALHNFIQVGAGHFLSLAILLSNPQVRQILYATGKSETPRKAFERYAATGMQLQLWYREDIYSPNFAMSVSTVRAIHDSMGRNMKLRSRKGEFSKPLLTPYRNPTGHWPNEKMWRAFQMDIENGREKLERGGKLRNGLAYFNLEDRNIVQAQPQVFSQYLMSVTQWCFVALPVIFPTRVGIPHWKEEELMGFAHLWAVISFALGMDENFILCRDPRDLEGCKKYLKEMFYIQILPGLFNIDFEGQLMIEALLKAVNVAAPGEPLSIDYFLIKILEDIVEIPATNLYAQTNWRTRFGRYISKNWILPLYRNNVGRRIVNATSFAAMHLGARMTFGDPGYNFTKVAQEFYVF